MRPRLWLLLVLTLVVLGGGVAHEALAGGDGKAAAAKQPVLTANQKAARKRLAETAAFLKENKLSCGCQHHFPAAPAAATSAP